LGRTIAALVDFYFALHRLPRFVAKDKIFSKVDFPLPKGPSNTTNSFS
jgi:hypothetical protein